MTLRLLMEFSSGATHGLSRYVLRNLPLVESLSVLSGTEMCQPYVATVDKIRSDRPCIESMVCRHGGSDLFQRKILCKI